MPKRLKKPCAYPGCPELVDAGHTYCEEHREKESRQRNKRYDKERSPASKKFYGGSRWRKVRNRYIKKNPLCEHCKEAGRTKLAHMVDHIIPIKINWEKRYDPDNLQSLCNSCHAKKTQEDKEKYNL